MAALTRGATVEEIIVTGAAMAGLAETDDQGRFTLEDIPPGRYSIAAGRLDLQTYYPGTQLLTDATVLTVKAGETITGINFALNSASIGRASSLTGIVLATPRITATIPVKVQAENGGKLPISADGQVVTLRLVPSLSPLGMPLNGSSFSVSGPGPADYRVVVENLPNSYEVKSIRYGNAVAPQGVFRLSAANFPTLGTATPVNVNTSPAAAQLLNAQSQLQLSLSALFAASTGAISVPTFTLIPATTPPSLLSITIGEAAPLSTGGVRVSGKSGSLEPRRIYISGRPGVVFDDGSFEFRGVPPGRHLIAAIGTPGKSAAIVVVGDNDVPSVELQDIFLLPDDVRQPKDPLPAGDVPPGTVVSMGRITGVVVDEQSRTALSEGNVVLRAGDYSRPFLINSQGRFESFTLLPGTYELRLEIFGHSTVGPTVAVEDKDVQIEVNARRLY